MLEVVYVSKEEGHRSTDTGRCTNCTRPRRRKCSVWNALDIASNKNGKHCKKFDMQKELEAYCKSDVELLKKGCEAFVKQFKKEADFNPFERCATIASACNLYWRRSIKNDTDAALIASRRSHSPLRTLFAFYQCGCRLSLTPSRSRKRSIACYRDQNDITNPSNQEPWLTRW